MPNKHFSLRGHCESWRRRSVVVLVVLIVQQVLTSFDHIDHTVLAWAIKLLTCCYGL